MMRASPSEQVRLVTFSYALQVCSLAPADGEAGRAVLDYLDTQESEFRVGQVGYVVDKGERIARIRADILQNERLDSLEAEVALLRQRVDNLQGELRALGEWVDNLDLRVAGLEIRVATLEEQVVDLQARVKALELWRLVTETRLTKVEQDIREIRTDIVFLSAILSLPLPGDADGDGLDDRAERLLIEAYSPVYKLDTESDRPPCSITWFIRHCYLQGPSTLPRGILRNDPSAILSVATSNSNKLRFDSESFRTGRSDIPGQVISWDSALRARNQGVYAHVVRGEKQDEIVVQYFLFSTWNETAYSGGSGNHEGDWGCVDVHVRIPELITPPDASGRVILEEANVRMAQRVLNDQSQKRDRIVGARFHNHGRFIDVRGDAVAVDGATGSPIVYLERGTNESWPNAGSRGAEGWPGPNEGGRSNLQNAWQSTEDRERVIRTWTSQFGYWIWYDFDWGNPLQLDFWGSLATSIIPGQGISEYKICREHSGEWLEYRTAGVPNLGERGSPMTEEARILFEYPGKWGGWWSHNSSPEGPPFNMKMWLERDPGSRYDGPKTILRIQMRR